MKRYHPASPADLPGSPPGGRSGQVQGANPAAGGSEGGLEVPIRSGTWLLYPGGAAPDAGAAIPKRLIVLDGSWRQARRMLIRLPELHRLPRLSLRPPAETSTRLRTPPSPEGMATFEAIAHAVEFLEGAAVARPLHRLWAQFVARSIRGPRRAYRSRP